MKNQVFIYCYEYKERNLDINIKQNNVGFYTQCTDVLYSLEQNLHAVLHLLHFTPYSQSINIVRGWIKREPVMGIRRLAFSSRSLSLRTSGSALSFKH